MSQKGKNHILEILLPQYLDSVVEAIRAALCQIDPSWKRGQFEVFSKHFRMNLLRSFFTQRFSLADAKFPLFQKDKILEEILEASQGLTDDKKAAYYGEVLSEYILLCSKERFPSWAEPYRGKPNFIIMWNLQPTIWLTIYK